MSVESERVCEIRVREERVACETGQNQILKGMLFVQWLNAF